MARSVAPLLTALCLAASSDAVSPVQKVIMLIDDMAAKVSKEVGAETKNLEEFATYCDNEATEKGYAIAGSKERIEELGAEVTDGEATIVSLNAKIEDISTQISEIEGELTTSTAQRNRDHEDFVATEKELVETVRSLANAQKLIEEKQQPAFLQAGTSTGALRGGERDAINAAVALLGNIVEASFVADKQRNQVADLLQARQESEEDYEYTNKDMNSNGILETLQQMEDKASESLTSARKTEQEKMQEYALFKQSLDSEHASLKQEMAESTMTVSSTTQTLKQAEKDLSVEKGALADDEAYLRDLKRDCQQKAGDFEVEDKDNKAELKALGAAKEILTKKFAPASFLQTGASVRLRTKARSDDDADVSSAKTAAIRVIEQLGKRLKSTVLVSLAYRAAEDPFAKVRGMVEEMIAKLVQEAAEEATQQAFCDKEIGESKTSEADKSGKLDKVDSRLERAEATIAILIEDVSKLSKEVADLDAASSTATQVRQSEKATFMIVQKDLGESQEACAAAIQVLREYYEGASLLQVSSRSRLMSKSKARAGYVASADDESQGDGGGILGLLEVAEGDFATSLAETHAVEQQAVTDFDAMRADTKMLKATKLMQIKGKESETKNLKMTVNDLSQDKEGITTERDAVITYLDKLKPQCETKGSTYAQRKSKRDQEIDGLKNALSILEGGGM